MTDLLVCNICGRQDQSTCSVTGCQHPSKMIRALDVIDSEDCAFCSEPLSLKETAWGPISPPMLAHRECAFDSYVIKKPVIDE